MEGVFQSLLTAESLVLCIVIALAVLVSRRIVQAVAKKVARIFPDKWEPYWVELWRENVLPYMPAGMGAAIGWLVEGYPYPGVFAESVAGRVFLGIVCGLASGLVYRHVKRLAKKKMPEQVEELEEKIGDLPESLTGNGDDPSEEENGE